MSKGDLLSIIPCHRRPERSLKIKGRPLVLCARCTAIYGSYILLPFLYFVPLVHNLFLALFLQLPMLIDGFTQKWKWRESNNTLRVITGLLSGIGQCMMIWYAADLLKELLS
ncbi:MULTISPECIES: DUF2085 domain-containing protein [Fictibacillus]|uniref:DUF2085 domain-containing protein n=1 Tax=Fictibacillus terranigra TaxID=3058424 RepID=A0ABT8ED81_9BACL|nr:DUF2085 domain-containing protein [Fictibacillus sp. CENA-BCM004]MDN4075894.1 DUF2085 domain-containing protein [Fictibacillus sp. CENA-BCM004]